MTRFSLSLSLSLKIPESKDLGSPVAAKGLILSRRDEIPRLRLNCEPTRPPPRSDTRSVCRVAFSSPEKGGPGESRQGRRAFSGLKFSPTRARIVTRAINSPMTRDHFYRHGGSRFDCINATRRGGRGRGGGKGAEEGGRLRKYSGCSASARARSSILLLRVKS